MDILSLPDEHLLHIFSFLSPVDLAWGVRRTCQRWKRLSYDRSLWKRIDLYQLGLHDKFSTSSFIEFLRGISERVQSLNFIKTKFHPGAYLHNDFYCSALKEIKLFGCEMSLDTMQNLLTKYKDIESVSLSLNIRSSSGFMAITQQLSELRKLKKLKIHNCILDDKHPLTFEASQLQMRQLFEAHHNLEFLSLVRCQMSNELYKLAIDNNPELREITFMVCGNLDADVFKTSNGTALKKLETLNLHNFGGTEFNDHVLKAVAEKVSHLKSVCLNSCGSLITTNGISFLVERCRCLTTIIISTGRLERINLTDAALEAIANSCALLKHLAVSYCPGIGHIGVVALASGCKLLEDLEIAGCSELVDESLQSLVENCPKLRKLNLKDCEQLTSKSINDAVVKLKHLWYLNLNNCDRLGDLDFNTTETNASAKLDGADDTAIEDIKDFDKSESIAVKMKELVGLMEVHSHISFLCIGNCTLLSDNCLRQVASFCPDIRELNVHENYNITDQSVDLIARSCKFLKKLDISGGFGERLTKLTDRCLHSIATLSHNIEHLAIMQNRNITINGINDVVINCPKIGLISVSTGHRVQVPGLRSAFSKINSKLVKLDILRGKANFVDIFVEVNKAARQTQE